MSPGIANKVQLQAYRDGTAGEVQVSRVWKTECYHLELHKGWVWKHIPVISVLPQWNSRWREENPQKFQPIKSKVSNSKQQMVLKEFRNGVQQPKVVVWVLWQVDWLAPAFTHVSRHMYIHVHLIFKWHCKFGNPSEKYYKEKYYKEKLWICISLAMNFYSKQAYDIEGSKRFNLNK